jgi:hypothetical protein
MFQISFISSGSSFSQTPIMASLSYNLVNSWIKQSKKLPDFPVACIFDLSSMYYTLQYFATDKILMKLNEITSILDLMRDSNEVDWSKCSIPSKFVHKQTNNPIIFMIPVFPRGITNYLTKNETTELSSVLMKISGIIEMAGCNYIIYDLPGVDTMTDNYSLIPPLLNSNFVIGVVDCNKESYDILETEINILQSFINKMNMLALPSLAINALVFNQVTERVKSEKWIENIEKTYNIPVIGKIREDPQLIAISSQFEIPTEEKHNKKLKSYKDFTAAVKQLREQLNSTNQIRNVEKNQMDILEEKIYTF